MMGVHHEWAGYSLREAARDGAALLKAGIWTRTKLTLQCMKACPSRSFHTELPTLCAVNGPLNLSCVTTIRPAPSVSV